MYTKMCSSHRSKKGNFNTVDRRRCHRSFPKVPASHESREPAYWTVFLLCARWETALLLLLVPAPDNVTA